MSPTAFYAIGIAWAKDRYLPGGARTFRDFATTDRMGGERRRRRKRLR